MAEKTPRYTHPGSIREHLAREHSLANFQRENDSPLDALNTVGMDPDDVKKTLESLRRLNESDEEFYRRLEALYIRAQNYLAKLLLYPESRSQVIHLNFAQVNNKVISEFISNLPGMQKKHRKDLNTLHQSALYCAIAKIMIALDELDKPEFKEREKIFQKFMDYIGRESQEGKAPFTVLSDIDDMSCIKLMWKDDHKARSACARRKRSDSILSKLIRTPEYDAAQALKDLIGLMFRIPQKDIAKRLVSTLKWVLSGSLKQSESTEIEIKFQNIKLSENIKKQIEKLCKQYGIQLTLTTKQSNKSSSSRYKSAKLVLHGFALNGQTLPGIEFRFFPEDSRDKGLSHHAVYEFVRDLAVMSRLFGIASKRWLEKRSIIAIEQIYGKNTQIDKEAKSKELVNKLLKEGRIKRIQIKRVKGNMATRYKV